MPRLGWSMSRILQDEFFRSERGHPHFGPVDGGENVWQANNTGTLQVDQIGQIFAYLAIVLFKNFFRKLRKQPEIVDYFFH
jgi:hypothetical protein